MIAYTMLYAAAVGVPVILAAWLVASVLRRYGRAERFVWLAGLVLAFALPMIGLLQRGASAATNGAQAAFESATGVIGLPAVLVMPDAPGPASLGWILLMLWLTVSAVLALRYAIAALRLARAGRSWREGVLDEVPVWLTDGIGPAVAGFVRPRVLVPSWLASMPTAQRSLVLLHEQEHIRAGDPWLMLLSRVAPIVVPWNPVVWLLSAHLLRAIELDCDRRVLRQRPDVRAYGATLIEISGRDAGRLVAVAAFAESEAPLRERILNMTTPSRTVSVAAVLTAMVLGGVLMAAACEIPVPTTQTELETEPQATTDAPPVTREVRNGTVPTPDVELGRTDLISENPTFTPFTVAPALQNMSQVQRALMDEYPAELREAGIGGTVNVWFFIDADGQVQATRIDDSSGYQPLDRAAIEVAGVFRFRPALNREQPVPVWVSLPITFQVR